MHGQKHAAPLPGLHYLRFAYFLTERPLCCALALAWATNPQSGRRTVCANPTPTPRPD